MGVEGPGNGEEGGGDNMKYLVKIITENRFFFGGGGLNGWG